MPLSEVRAVLRTLVEEGHRCPCCTQLAKVYRRRINSSQARNLILTYRANGREFGYLQKVRRSANVNGRDNREESKLRYWGLIEEASTRRPDGGRAGWWRVTEKGEQWIHGRITVPKYARIYDTRCLQLLGDPVTIKDALGKRFDYNELMGYPKSEAS